MSLETFAWCTFDQIFKTLLFSQMCLLLQTECLTLKSDKFEEKEYLLRLTL